MSTLESLAPTRRTHVMQFVGNNIVGGMETYVQRLVERLPKDRFRVTVVCPYESRYSERLRGHGAEVLVLSMPEEDPCWTSLCSAVAYIRAEQVDVLQAHLTNAHELAGLAGHLTGTPVVYTNHGRRLSSEDLEVHRLTGTHIGVVCKYTEMHALGLGIPRDHVHLIPNGVDTAVFTPRRERQGALRRRFGIPAEAPVVGFVGRLSIEKGPETCLRAMLLAHQAVPEMHIVMVGTGPTEPNVRNFVASFQMESYAHLAGLQDDMPAVMSEFDLFVSSSHSEAMPLSMMEAMAAGLPVVGTRVGGVPDMIQHGGCGFLVEKGDINAISSSVRTLLQQPELRQRMGAAARERAMTHFALADSVNATCELLQHLALQRAMARSATASAAPKAPAANEAIAPKMLAAKGNGRTARTGATKAN
ncbi:glycosyltransferase [Ideonella sp. BN130291]|uniref:glycosyltransferase n=1 Tax=Ideonella sp. BN130291 TaxID=3112940 RepID=UPI002E26CAF2|nr:glycosyltransferase [Ideonella sp. BN130291]